MTKLICSKRYDNIPFAHRAPFHDGHCASIHGHNWSFVFQFAADAVDVNGFVMDFGKLRPLRERLESLDHALVLSTSDPELAYLQETLGKRNLARIVVIDDCSCEGIARWGFHTASQIVENLTDRRARVTRCEVHEDERNAAVFERSAAAGQ